MKQSPVCKTTYTDESLRYCLADGATLTSEFEEPTVFAGKADPLRVDIVEGAAAKNISSEATRDGSSRGWLRAVTAFGIIGLVFIAAVLIAVAILYMNTGGRGTPTKAASPTPAPTATADPEKQRLQDELSNLQRKLDEQKDPDRRTANAVPFPTTIQPGTVTARVNSQNDGFLALRNIPDAERGERIAKIPHGSVVTVNNCEKT